MPPIYIEPLSISHILYIIVHTYVLVYIHAYYTHIIRIRADRFPVYIYYIVCVCVCVHLCIVYKPRTHIGNAVPRVHTDSTGAFRSTPHCVYYTYYTYTSILSFIIYCVYAATDTTFLFLITCIDLLYADSTPPRCDSYRRLP